METDQLIQYIKEEHSRGVNHEVIYDKLISSGWSKESVKQGFISVFGTVQTIKILQLPSTEYFMKETSSFYGSYGKLLLTISLIPNLFSLFLWVIALLVFKKTSASSTSLYWSLPAAMIGIFIQIWSKAALIFTITNHKNTFNLKGVIIQSWSRLFKFWWTGGLVSVVIFIGFLLLIIPGILFTTWLIYTPYIFFEENLNGVSALKRSYYYAKGYFWAIVWRTFGIGMSLSIIGIGVSLIVRYSGFKILETPISLALNTFLTPIPFIYIYLLYQKLKEIKSTPLQQQ